MTMKTDWIDSLRPELGRRVQVTRDLPIEELTPRECKALLSHCHGASLERHKAYWEKWWAWRQSPEGVAWDKAVVAKRLEVLKTHEQREEERRLKERLDLIYVVVGGLLQLEMFIELNQILITLQVMTEEEALAWMTATFPAKNKLPYREHLIKLAILAYPEAPLEGLI